MPKDPSAPKKAKKSKAAAPSDGPPPPTMTKPRRMAPPPMPRRLPPPDIEGDELAGDLGIMPPSPEERIAEWVETGVISRNKPNATLQLCHYSMNGEVAVQEWRMLEDFADQDGSSVATTIYGHAAEDAENQQSPSSRYSVNALDSSGRRFTRIIFAVTPESMDPGRTMGGESEERHTQEGHLAQSYRHTEQFARMMLAVQLTTARQSIELHRELGATRTQLHKQQIESVELFQNMKDREAMRQIMIGKHKRAEMVKDAAMGLVMKFAPHVAQRIGLMTDDEAAQLQTTDAVSDWLAAMPEDEGQRMISGITDPIKRKAFERAWIMAKKRAAARAAKAALSGRPAPGQLPAGNTNGAAAGGAAAQPTPIQFTAEESAPLNKTTLVIINMLIGIDDAIFAMALPRIPQEAHEQITSIRNRVRSDSHTALSGDEWRSAVVELRPHVIKMLSTISDQDVLLLLTQIDNAGHKLTVQQALKIVRDKFKAAAA